MSVGEWTNREGMKRQVILKSQKNATDEGAIALKALDFQINVKIISATLILVDSRDIESGADLKIE